MQHQCLLSTAMFPLQVKSYMLMFAFLEQARGLRMLRQQLGAASMVTSAAAVCDGFAMTGRIETFAGRLVSCAVEEATAWGEAICASGWSRIQLYGLNSHCPHSIGTAQSKLASASSLTYMRRSPISWETRGAVAVRAGRLPAIPWSNMCHVWPNWRINSELCMPWPAPAATSAALSPVGIPCRAAM